MSILLRRREFIAGLGGAAAAWPLAAQAQQQAGGVPRIGYWVTSSETSPVGQLRFAAFRKALAQLGWADGRDIRIDHLRRPRWPTQERGPRLGLGFNQRFQRRVVRLGCHRARLQASLPAKRMSAAG